MEPPTTPELLTTTVPEDPATTTNSATARAFALPDRLAAKADPALVAVDEQHLAAVARCLERTVADLSERLAAARRAPGGTGREALERDQQVHRLTARLRVLRRSGPDLCLGRMVRADDPVPVYVGRLGLTDAEGRRLLLDWRSPAAAPFFGATHADPMGLASRRRYRWSGGRISDYWDEVFDPGELDPAAGRAALDDRSAFIASLGASRSPRMRDVLATLQADQDAVVRAGSRGALVVDGGPGTGKTVVALHRAAYLLHSDPRLRAGRGGVLFVGPHQPYLAYVADVLPSLGEDGVQTCTLRHLVPEGAAAGVEADPEAARLKASTDLVDAVEAAVRFSEEPPAEAMTISTPWDDVRLTPEDWADAFDAPAPGTPHDEAREQVRDELVEILVGRHDDAPPDLLRRWLERDGQLRAALDRAWPLLDAADVVADLWSVPAYLRRCAPRLRPEDVRRLQRADARAWTTSDLPLLDAARHRIGDAGAARRARRREAVAAAERERRRGVVDDLIATDDSEMLVMSMLRGHDLASALDDGSVLPEPDPDLLAGPFAHVVVDEAQELTDAEWRMLLRRCPSRSFTVVGDRTQARRGFPESWHERLERVGFDRITPTSLSINYRTPEEVMAEAEPVIRAAVPDADVPTSVRSSGVPVVHGSAADLDAVVGRWLAAHAEGTACVVGAPAPGASPRVRSLPPELTKGLEFDLVVLVDPEGFGEGVGGAVDRYVAMTRATRQLVVLTSG